MTQKSFKQYLAESKKTYSFKLRVAGELADDVQEKLQAALSKFSIVSLSKGTRSPIRAASEEFPNLPNIRVTVWDVEIAYPTIPPVLEQCIAAAIQVPSTHITVRNFNDQLEQYITNQSTEVGSKEAQQLVGANRTLSLLKDLASVARTTGEQYKGVNDEILATDAPKEKTSEPLDSTSSPSVLGSKGK